MYLITLMLQEAENGGLTIGDFIADLPHDPAAILLYVLTALSLFLVWSAHRKKPDAADDAQNTSATAPGITDRTSTDGPGGGPDARAEPERERA